MEPYHIWREEYRREVEKVLDEMRAGKDEASPGPVVIDLVDGIIPPSKVHKELQAALADAASLRRRVEEMTSGLEAKSRELEAELRRRGRLKDLAIKLHLQVDALEREAEEARHGAQECGDESRRSAEAAQQAQTRLQEALQELEAERQRTRQAQVRAASFQSGIDDLQMQLDAKGRELSTLQARADVAEQDFRERLQRFEARGIELEGGLEEARRRAAGVDALETGYRRQLQEARQAQDSLEARLEAALRQNDELRQQATQTRREALKLEDEAAQRALDEGRALQAAGLRQQQETERAQRESAARRAEAEELMAEAQRREAAAEKSLLDADQVKAASAEVAKALCRESERLRDEAMGGKERLRAECEAGRAQAEAEVRTELESLRLRLRQLTESQAAAETEREQLRAELVKQRQEGVEKQDRIASLLKQLEETASPMAPPALSAPPAAAVAVPHATGGQDSAAAASPRRGLRAWILLGAAALILFSGWWFGKPLGTAGRDYPLPFARPGALAWQGDMLWVADPQAQALHRFKLESGRLREDRSFPLPGSRVAGLAVAGGALYVADAGANEIQKRRVDDALTLDKSWPVAAQDISALASDGKSLFAAFSKPGRIRQYALDENLSFVNTFFGPPNPVGMAVEGGALWTADGDSRLLLRYSVDSALSLRETRAVPGLGPGALSGFALRRRAVWFVQDGRALVLERPLAMLEDRALTDIPAEAPAAPPSPAPGP
ncbi:MAG: hypothetical protein NTY77_00590 [Elusimicrobia bacterium]|nr:hypothetical protein [Elusimicrobiota bacterium]